MTSEAELRESLHRAGYIADEGLATTLWLAGELQRPLLVEGDAGVGKTSLNCRCKHAAARHGALGHIRHVRSFPFERDQRHVVAVRAAPAQPARSARRPLADPARQACASPALQGLTAPRKAELFRQFAESQGQQAADIPAPAGPPPCPPGSS